MAKPDVIKGPSRKCGGCVRKVAGVIPGGLPGVPGCPSTHGVFVGWDGTAVFVRASLAGEESAEAVLPVGVVLVAGKG